MSSPVLDGARVVDAKTWRYDVTAMAPMNERPEPLRAGADGEARELSDREKWRRLGHAEVVGLAAHHGVSDGAQIDLYVSSNTMLGFGGKLRLADSGMVALALGAHAHVSAFSLIFDTDDDEKEAEGYPAVRQLSVPLWLGLEPDPWLSIYLNMRPQLWWVEPLGVTGVLAQTAGVRLGGSFGVIAEATYVYEPFFDSSGFQAAFALYFNTGSSRN